MDNYILAEDTEPSCCMPFPEELSSDVMQFEIKKNTKFGGIIARVEKEFQKEDQRRMIFHGLSECSVKCIALVEILKSKLSSSENIIYQWNILKASKSTDTWAPSDERMDRLVVEKNAPKIFIMLSRDPFSANHQCAGQQSTSESFPSFLNLANRSSLRKSEPRPGPYKRQSDPSKSSKKPAESSNKWKRKPWSQKVQQEKSGQKE